MRKSIRLTTVLAVVTVAAAILSAQSAGTPPSAPPGTAPAARSADIVGIRLGMPLRDAYTILQTAHPTVKLGMYPNTLPGIEKPVLEGFAFLSGFKGVGITEERVVVHVTPPPNKQVVWKMVRQLSQQKIYRANVLSSLREKYGKETGTTPFVANDQQVTDLWWVFDEQGHPAKLPSPGANYQDGVQTVAACARRFIESDDPGSSWFVPDNLMRSLSGLDLSDWCNSSGIAVHASFGPAEIVSLLRVEMFHVPLAGRAAKAEIVFVTEAGKRQHQQQIDEAKQAKPKL